MRLRRLTEAECYARCYGWRGEDIAGSLQVLPSRKEQPPSGDRARQSGREARAEPGRVKGSAA